MFFDFYGSENVSFNCRIGNTITEISPWEDVIAA
jgi:hypothetical protein